MERTDTILVYSDTDSWKCCGDLENAIKAQEEYNAYIEKIVHNSIDYFIGYFDYECQYTDYCTLGCKKYITSDGQKIVTTIAGVSKKAASAAYTELYKSLHYDFDELCKIAFNPCTILSWTVTDKLITKYNTGFFNENVTDENGTTGTIKGYNMVELVNSDYVLMDYDKGNINEYIDYFNTLQGVEANIIPTYIYRDDTGAVRYKYITDWNEAINVLRGEDVNYMNIVNGGQI